MPEERPLAALGLMSGTSMDGIDVALLRTDGEDVVERGPSGFHPYPASLRRRIEAALAVAADMDGRNDRPGDLAALEVELTDRHAAAVQSFLIEHEIPARTVDLVGFHGQTVLHRPERRLTVQLGDAGLLARATGLRVVHDMRQIDVEAGGQGAPLAPVYHRALARSFVTDGEVIAFLNIGGISNVTIVGRELIAFDTGPGNALIDQWVQQSAGVPFDQNGALAATGRVDEAFVIRMLLSPYFRVPPPKSLDRNDFALPPDWQPTVADGARTLARLTAEAVAAHVPAMEIAPDRWIVCGGGAKNPVIMQDLQNLLRPAEVVTAGSAGLSSDAMEAEAWAYLAVRVARGLPISEPGTTGRGPLERQRPKFADWL